MTITDGGNGNGNGNGGDGDGDGDDGGGVEVVAQVVGGKLDGTTRVVRITSNATSNIVVAKDGGTRNVYYVIDSAYDSGPRYVLLYCGPYRSPEVRRKAATTRRQANVVRQ